MSDRLKVVQMTRTCYACPAQWDGITEDGREVYVRYRGGYGYVGVASPEEPDPVAPEVPFAEFDKGPGTNPYDGYLTYAELKRLVPQIDWPEQERE